MRVDRALEFCDRRFISVRREGHRASYDLEALPHGLVDAQEAAQVQVSFSSRLDPLHINA